MNSWDTEAVLELIRERDRLREYVNTLNKLVRKCGLGQGEIDTWATLEEDNARLRAALEAVEWLPVMEYNSKYCPWCKWENGFGGSHAPDCARQRALGVTK